MEKFYRKKSTRDFNKGKIPKIIYTTWYNITAKKLIFHFKILKITKYQ